MEEWHEKRIEAVLGGGSKRVNPEQVNAAVDRHGLSGCFLLWPSVLCTRGPEKPAKAAARVGRLGPASQERQVMQAS